MRREVDKRKKKITRYESLSFGELGTPCSVPTEKAVRCLRVTTWREVGVKKERRTVEQARRGEGGWECHVQSHPVLLSRSLWIIAGGDRGYSKVTFPVDCSLSHSRRTRLTRRRLHSGRLLRCFLPRQAAVDAAAGLDAAHHSRVARVGSISRVGEHKDARTTLSQRDGRFRVNESF